MAAETASAYPRYHRQFQQDRRARPATGSGRAARHMPAPRAHQELNHAATAREDLIVITGGPPCRAAALRVPAVALVAAKLPGPAGSKKLACTKRDVTGTIWTPEARGLRLACDMRQ